MTSKEKRLSCDSSSAGPARTTRMRSLPRIAILPSETDPEHSPDPVSVYISRLSVGSRRAMLQVLRVIAAELGGGVHDVAWHRLRYKDTQAVRRMLSSRYAPATANRALSALRGVLEEALRLEMMTSDDHRRAVDLRPVRGLRVQRGRALSLQEIGALYVACQFGTAQGARDAAMIALCFGAGLRRAEAVALELNDYDPASPAVRVKGKGNKQRKVFLSGQSASIVSAWIAVRGDDDGPLLVGVDKTDRIRFRHLSPEAVAVILRRLTQRSGLARTSPHDLRRGFVSSLLDLGVDLATVQTLAGHGSPTTTARYDRRPETVQKRAANLLVVPIDRSTRQIEDR